MKVAVGKNNDLQISLQNSVIVCKAIKGKKTDKAAALLEGLVEEKRDIGGRYYTNASKEILKILNTTIANAKVKGYDDSKLYVKTARANKGFVFIKPKSRFKFRGRKAKSSSIVIEVEER